MDLMPSKLLLTWLLLSSAAVAMTQGLEIVQQSPEEMLVTEGSEQILSCEVDSEVDFCKWRLPSGAVCLATGPSQECDTDRIVSLIGNVCELQLPSIERSSDSGTFTCLLTKADVGTEAESASANIDVQVAVQSIVHFAEHYSFEDPVPVKLDQGVTVECHARGGWPEPTISAALGWEEGVMSVDDEYLTAAEGVTEVVNNDDGTVDIVQYFTLVPSMADCGKFVKCEAIQRDQNGEVLFTEGDSVVSKKIMVTFPPQELADPFPPVAFTPGEPFVDVEIVFMANPVPLMHEVKWHIEFPEDSGYEPVEIFAGNNLFEKYSASDLNVTDHEVVATFTIFNLTYADEDQAYALKVSNGEGEATYPFRLSTRTLLITTPAPVNGNGDGTQAQQGGVSGGTIAAIVIVVLIVIGGLLAVFWAKKNNKWCFRAYDPVRKTMDLESRPAAMSGAPIPTEPTRVSAPPPLASSPPMEAPKSSLDRPDDSDSEEQARRKSTNSSLNRNSMPTAPEK